MEFPLKRMTEHLENDKNKISQTNESFEFKVKIDWKTYPSWVQDENDVYLHDAVIIHEGAENANLEDKRESFEVFCFRNELRPRKSNNSAKRPVESFPESKKIMHAEAVNDKAFSVKYDESQGQSRMFLQNLKYCYEKVRKPNSKLAPYLFVVQSSGTGKTRLFFELGHQKFTVLYFNLRKPEDSGFPMGIYASNRFIDSLRAGGQFFAEKFIMTAVACAHSSVLIQNDDVNHKHPIRNKTEAEKFWIWVLDETARDDKIKKFDEIYANSPRDAALEFLFCFDEASILENTPFISSETNAPENLFTALRRGIISLHQKPIFYSFLDTFLKISNFSPPMKLVSSSRFLNKIKFDLAHPFIYLFCGYTLFNSPALLDINLPPKAGEKVEDYLRLLFSIGRPLWWSYLLQNICIDKLLTFAKQKLICSYSDEISSLLHAEKLKISLAVLGACVFLDISPHSELASQLVQSHMAYLVGVDSARETLIVHFSTEPILTEVSLSFFSTHYEMCLAMLNYSLSRGYVEGGPRGELVARIALVMCTLNVPQCDPNARYYSRPILLTQWLRQLDVFDLDGYWNNAEVFFAGFIQIQVMPTLEMIKNAFRMGKAFILKNCYPGADLLIPIRVWEGNKTVYSFILLQIKNHALGINKGTKKLTNIIAKLHPWSVFAKSCDEELAFLKRPFIALFWQTAFDRFTCDRSAFLVKPNTSNLTSPLDLSLFYPDSIFEKDSNSILVKRYIEVLEKKQDPRLQNPNFMLSDEYKSSFLKFAKASIDPRSSVFAMWGFDIPFLEHKPDAKTKLMHVVVDAKVDPFSEEFTPNCQLIYFGDNFPTNIKIPVEVLDGAIRNVFFVFFILPTQTM